MISKSLAVVLGMVLTSTVQAQMRQMPPDPYDPGHAAQPANVQQPAPAAQQPALPAANDYPAAEVQAVPAALARRAMANAEFDNAQSGLHQLIDQLKEDFEYSADLSAAMRNEKAAYERYTSARQRVLRQLNESGEYRTLQNLCKDLNDRLYNLKANPEANRTEIIATAELKLAYATKASDMESDAIKADSAVQDAKTKLVDASSKVSDMRSAFRRSVRRDPKVALARRDLDDARVARVTASAMLDGAVEARDIALDYAYYLHFHDPYTYRYSPNYYDSSLYDYSGVGLGYGVSPNLITNPFNNAGNNRRFRDRRF
jgi:hypothetical protein